MFLENLESYLRDCGAGSWKAWFWRVTQKQGLRVFFDKNMSKIQVFETTFSTVFIREGSSVTTVDK